jgi:hypothetical protein
VGRRRGGLAPVADAATATAPAETDAERASTSVQLPLDVLREFGYTSDAP